MTLKEFIIQHNREATDEVFRQTKALAADKVDWSPGDHARSALKQLAECSLSPLWAIDLMVKRKFEMSEELMAEFQSMTESLKTIEECEKTAYENLAKLEEAIRAFPESDMDQTIHIPFGAVQDRTYASVMALQFWNATYHSGQICYIQLLAGDTEMH